MTDSCLRNTHSFVPSKQYPPPQCDSGTFHFFPKRGPNIPISTAACQVYRPLLPREETDEVVLSPFSRNWILSDDSFYTVTDWFCFKGWDNIHWYLHFCPCPFIFLCFWDWNKFFQTVWLFFINKFSCWNHEFISMSWVFPPHWLYQLLDKFFFFFFWCNFSMSEKTHNQKPINVFTAVNWNSTACTRHACTY